MWHEPQSIAGVWICRRCRCIGGSGTVANFSGTECDAPDWTTSASADQLADLKMDVRELSEALVYAIGKLDEADKMGSGNLMINALAAHGDDAVYEKYLEGMEKGEGR